MSFLCGVCDKGTSGTRSLLCRSCDVWYHADCENVSKSLFNTLDKNRSLAYTCAGCIESPPDNSDSAFKAEMRNGFAVLKAHANDMKNEQLSMKSRIESAVGEIRAELSNSLKEIKQDVLECKNLVVSHDKANRNRFYALELQNHVLQHRLNRSDIIITGLSDKLDDLKGAVNSICNHLQVELIPGDIVDAMYIRNHHAVLVKFGRVGKRDKLMSAYFKYKSLKVSDAVGGNDNSRIYINDNYSTLATKLLKTCWKLKSDKKINGYSIINRETLKVKILMANNESKTFDFQECINFFNINS